MTPKFLTTLLTMSSLLSSSAFAADTKAATTSVLPFTGPNLNDVVLDSQLVVSGSSGALTTLDIYVSCFGTNLRSVPNPISEYSQLFAKLRYLTVSGAYKQVEIQFPATATMNTYGAGAAQNITNNTVVNGDAKVHLDASLKGNLIRINLSEAKTIPVDVLASGTDFTKLSEFAVKSEFLKDISFRQEVATTPSQFMAFNGPVTASSQWYVSENGKTLTMLASFPGENRFCGGYFSPIVLKFDDESLPVVNDTSYFPLFEGKPHKISWPTFKSETYLLTYDANKNGKVDAGSELFGDINNYQDGFKNLAAYDENKDGVIDAKDPIWAHLRLWRDSNQDGKSSAKEIKTLKDMGVESISLKYENTTQDLNNHAKVVGPGEFTYRTKKGDIKKGRVWDIFLKIVP
ncbi:hypothetical protein DOM22_08935 [Bdellovibrio sp. ZAP7]|uniref:hypothetical protein n=1 Tax=Bdellovibrio sp. ZAP7 TaxID=2231053 RepID=UPI0011573571|nr:hypothetical protein [Bdellovibrio sp. ZAP7]QDK45268.1 hypothetical protein DOM22_08935 [Bdellovibrio sp. ZAP7]